MREKFQIEITELKKWISPFQHRYNIFSSPYDQSHRDIKRHLTTIFEQYNDEQILDGKALSNIFFPTNLRQNFNVFISHSGIDKMVVRDFVDIMYREYGTPCFADWMVWGDLEKMQKIMDEKFAVLSRDKEGKILSYNYTSRNYTTAHTHAMLSMALLDMIDQCHVCLFIKSQNSTLPSANFGDVTTLSPWIYEEISYMNHIEKRRQYFSEGVGQAPPIAHPLDLSGFKPLTATTLLPALSRIND